MSNNTGGPAFARPASPAHEYGFHKHQEGMTLRDYFAAKAMLGLLARGDNSSRPAIADYSYAMADAMIAARDQ